MSAREPDALLEQVLASALELRAAGELDWLAQACRDHPHLGPTVLELALSADRQAQGFKDYLSSDRALGTTLNGRYLLESRLGAGAMGIVYRALDLDLQRNVAVKLLRGDTLVAGHSDARFLREAEVMASVRHPAVVTLHDRGISADGQPFQVMELLEGVPLSAILDEARRREGAVLADDPAWLAAFIELSEVDRTSYLRLVTRWAAELASGLEAVHRAGALHRDVKPSNIFLTREGRAVLLDFGVAAREGNATLTREGGVVGTPVYMAPEALRSRQRPRPALDVYGLTATLYHLLTLQPPHAGSATQVMAMILARDPRPASSLRPGLPRDLQAILDKGMDRRADARYASAALLESDLRAFLEYRPIVARPTTPLARWARRMRRSTLVQGAGLMALVIGLLYGASALRGWHHEGRARRYAALARQFPPNFTIVSPANRRYRHEADRAEVGALLDRATELCDDPLPSHLLRSSFRFDHGDLVGAAQDMAVVAGRVGTPLARELAARYARLGPQDLPRTSIALEDLPDPLEPLDIYLLAYHLLRAGEYARARPLLADARIADIDHAQELHLAGADFSGLSAAEEKERASRLHSDAIRLEERIGQRTAGSAHVIARMASIQGRYVEALEAARAGLELSERSHGLRVTAGMMAWRLGLDEEARAHWSTAIDLQPDDPKPYRNLMWLHLERGELEEVELLIDRTPFGGDAAAERQRLAYRARVATERALRSRSAGDLTAAAEHARLGASFLERARDLGPFSEDAFTTINGALLSAEPQGVFIGLAELLAEDPFRWQRLEQLLEDMPEDLDEPATAAMRRFLEALHADLASQRRVGSAQH